MSLHDWLLVGVVVFVVMALWAAWQAVKRGLDN